jgi:quercetin dioxygenase-like cupin family protein
MKLNKYLPLLLFAFSFSLSNVYAQSKNEMPEKKETTQTKYTIDNCITKFSKDKIEKTDAGYQFWFVDKNFADGKTLKLSVVGPHTATHPPHVHPEDEIFFILEGKMEVFLVDQWKAVDPFTSFYCPSNVKHGIRNVGDTEAKYLVIKKYETTTNTK